MSDMRKSELSKWRLNELCCKRTIYRWNRLELNFPLMYGTCTGTSQPEQNSVVQGALSNTVGVLLPIRNSTRIAVAENLTH